ncbi:hypothetical protein GRI38_08065 [Altererythrobacter aurantiacus]|uniref:DUF5681 domain-containing protein n=1 Tax=Parapontixanthobacter aurantiacus TaxID=1463599 RepID=A0A844ZG91_9SPHN|nr:DUF5681 domain-containing protein [Parapontixanthobacter aurantiacus]MXO85987.1 hypothetical protein [Parapontixanthobacter aurantiacus]
MARPSKTIMIPGKSNETPTEPKVGPGYPPKATRFKPGQSGNPKGRPKKDRSFVKRIEAELDSEMQVEENGVTIKLSKREVLAKRMVNDSLKGDPRMLNALLKFLPAETTSAQDEVEVVSRDEVIAFLARHGKPRS